MTRRARVLAAVAATASLAGAALLGWAVIVEPGRLVVRETRVRALPLIGRPVVPSRYGARYAYGVVVEGGRTLFVSPACFRAPSNSSPGFQLGMFLPSATFTPR